ncbi:hypothetical protein [Vibrio phage phiKT1028]|nr:hypothetical protein [Vibrio phage phiKT1028]
MINAATNTEKTVEEIAQDLLNKVQEDQKAPSTSGRKGYNGYVLVGGAIGAAGTAALTQNPVSAIGGLATTLVASYFFSQEDREGSFVKDGGIGLAAGVAGTLACDLGMSKFNSGDESDTPTENESGVALEVTMDSDPEASLESFLKSFQ